MNTKETLEREIARVRDFIANTEGEAANHERWAVKSREAVAEQMVILADLEMNYDRLFNYGWMKLGAVHLMGVSWTEK